MTCCVSASIQNTRKGPVPADRSGIDRVLHARQQSPKKIGETIILFKIQLYLQHIDMVNVFECVLMST
jgi:hypothetical protein